MRICDIPEDKIQVGLRVISFTGRHGTVVSKDVAGCDDYWWIQWDGDQGATSGFFYNDCECEIIKFEDFTPEDLDAAFKARRAFDPDTANKFLEEAEYLINKYGA